MKTIFVIFSSVNSVMENSKKYCFNTESEVNIGDIISSTEYTSKMIVTNILDKKFSYYNEITGELSNILMSTRQGEIKTLEIRNNDPLKIYGEIVGRINI